jgi:hypothetical protein
MNRGGSCRARPAAAGGRAGGRAVAAAAARAPGAAAAAAAAAARARTRGDEVLVIGLAHADVEQHERVQAARRIVRGALVPRVGLPARLEKGQRNGGAVRVELQAGRAARVHDARIVHDLHAQTGAARAQQQVRVRRRAQRVAHDQQRHRALARQRRGQQRRRRRRALDVLAPRHAHGAAQRRAQPRSGGAAGVARRRSSARARVRARTRARTRARAGRRQQRGVRLQPHVPAARRHRRRAARRQVALVAQAEADQVQAARGSGGHFGDNCDCRETQGDGNTQAGWR